MFFYYVFIENLVRKINNFFLKETCNLYYNNKFKYNFIIAFFNKYIISYKIN